MLCLRAAALFEHTIDEIWVVPWSYHVFEWLRLIYLVSILGYFWILSHSLSSSLQKFLMLNLCVLKRVWKLLWRKILGDLLRLNCHVSIFTMLLIFLFWIVLLLDCTVSIWIWPIHCHQMDKALMLRGLIIIGFITHIALNFIIVIFLILSQLKVQWGPFGIFGISGCPPPPPPALLLLLMYVRLQSLPQDGLKLGLVLLVSARLVLT